MDYIITFTGYIDERKRPENFPRKIEDVQVVSFPDGDALVNYVNKRVFMYAANQGMGVAIDKGAMEDMRIIDTNRMWVPTHMITHITATYKTIMGEMPQVAANGITEMPSGKDIVKN
jgi:hypothetical protein